MKRRRAAVLILGAGPAGCAAAITARLAGLSVVLLEAHAAPRAQPGETLHPGVEPIFRQLGVWEALVAERFPRQRGLWREGENGARVFEPYGYDTHGPWLGFQADRVRLGGLLRARAVALGGKIIRVARVDAVLRGESAVAGVRAEGCEYHASAVLDATGRQAWLAEKLGLLAERLEPAQRVRFGWKNEERPELDGQPLFRQRADGWDWLAPLGEGRCAWATLRRTAAGGGTDYAWRIFRACAGPGYFLLGDAACLMDPSAANGVLRALMSGICAAHFIAAAQPPAAADAYRRWIAELFDRSYTEWKTASGGRGLERLVGGAISKSSTVPQASRGIGDLEIAAPRSGVPVR